MASKFAPSASFLASLKASADADRKIKLVDRILKEIELVEYFHTKCPEKLTDKDWNRLLRTTKVSERVSMLEYFALTQKREAADQLQKEERRKAYDEYMANERAKYEAGGMGYGPDLYAPLLNPFRNEKNQNLISGAKQWSTRRIAEKPKIAIDCQYFQNIPVRDMSKMGAQVQMVINENEVVRRTPFHMEYLNLDTTKPQIAEVSRLFLMHLNQKYGHQRIMPDVYSNMPYKHGDKKVLYVTRYAKQFFDGPLPEDKTIIVPATMDNNRESINYCRRMKFTPIYLPIRKYVKWQVGAFYMPLPNMLRVFNEVSLNGGDWATAVEKNVAYRHKQTIEERREKLGARYDKKYQELQERKEVIRMIQEALDKDSQRAMSG